jgi:hypothetical protein
MSIASKAQAAFFDRFGDQLNEAGVLIEDADVTYWQDDISEMADSLVPVYTSQIVDEWVSAGYPDVDDPGLIDGVTDVTKIMAVALYELYSQALYELAYEAEFDQH